MSMRGHVGQDSQLFLKTAYQTFLLLQETPGLRRYIREDAVMEAIKNSLDSVSFPQRETECFVLLRRV